MSTTDGKGILVGATKKKKLYVAKVSENEHEINLRVANACPVKIIKVQ
jgi:ferredoxin